MQRKKEGMYFKKRVFILLMLCVTALSVNAQIQRNSFKTLEFFAGAGATLYFGDIGGRDANVKGAQIFFDNLDIDLWRARPIATAGLRFNLNKSFAASLQLSPTFISGSDKRSDKWERDYSFNTFIGGINLQAEYYLANRLTNFSPYLLVGLGEIIYTYNSVTENSYSKLYNTNTYIFGMGFRFPPKNGISHSLEFAYHFANSDMIDGYPDVNSNHDVYFTTTYKINLEMNAGR